MKFGTTWFGFRDFTATNYLSAAAALGLSYVEVPLYWHIIEDARFDPLRSAELLALAEEAGVRLHAGVAALELATPFDVLGRPIEDSAVQMRTLLDAADHTNVGTLFDPCNYFRMGDDPTEALRLVSDRIYYCHLKDAIWNDPRSADQLSPGSRWRPSVAVGRDDIDWATLIPALESTYDGVVAFECEMPGDVIAATRQSRNFVASIHGDAST